MKRKGMKRKKKKSDAIFIVVFIFMCVVTSCFICEWIFVKENAYKGNQLNADTGHSELLGGGDRELKVASVPGIKTFPQRLKTSHKKQVKGRSTKSAKTARPKFKKEQKKQTGKNVNNQKQGKKRDEKFNNGDKGNAPQKILPLDYSKNKAFSHNRKNLAASDFDSGSNNLSVSEQQKTSTANRYSFLSAPFRTKSQGSSNRQPVQENPLSISLNEDASWSPSTQDQDMTDLNMQANNDQNPESDDTKPEPEEPEPELDNDPSYPRIDYFSPQIINNGGVSIRGEDFRKGAQFCVCHDLEGHSMAGSGITACVVLNSSDLQAAIPANVSEGRYFIKIINKDGASAVSDEPLFIVKKLPASSRYFYDIKGVLKNNLCYEEKLLRVFDPRQNLVGITVVQLDGQYTNMHLYLDDPTTELKVEGLQEGDKIDFELEGGIKLATFDKADCFCYPEQGKRVTIDLAVH